MLIQMKNGRPMECKYSATIVLNTSTSHPLTVRHHFVSVSTLPRHCTEKGYKVLAEELAPLVEQILELR